MSVTIKDISEHTGLAISTISKYINGGNVLPENQKKIQKAIDELKFCVNPFARSMKTNKSYLIGVVVSSGGNYIYSLLLSLQRQFMAYGYCFIVEQCDDSAESQDKATNFLLTKNIDALIFFNMKVKLNDYGLYRDKPIPVLTIGNKPENVKCDQIVLDDYAAVDHVVRFLSTTANSIAYLGGSQDEQQQMSRYNGYQNALNTIKMEFNDKYVSFGESNTESGYRRMCELLKSKDRPQAVLIADGNLVVGAYIAIKEFNLKVPQDITIATFENKEIPESCADMMNLLVLPEEKICSFATKTLMNKINNNEEIFQSILIPFELRIESE